jgi:hypothetical protein
MRRWAAALAFAIRALACVAVLAGPVGDAVGQPARCGPPASAVSKSGAITRLRFANGTRATLTDEPEGDGRVTYEYRGYDDASGLHWVRLVLWGGPSFWVEAYAGCTGTKLVLDDIPVVPPDGSRLVTIGRGVPPRPLVNRIHVLARAPSGEYSVEWDFELSLWARSDGPLAWGPVNPRWVSATSLTFDRVDAQGRLVGTAVAIRDDRGWHFAVVK